MKKALAVAGLGAMITLGSLVGAGTASADNSQDVQFIALLEYAGIQGNALGIPMAYGACANVDANRYSYGLWPATDHAIDQVYYASPGLTRDGALRFVSAAIVVYCPWNLLSGNNNGGSVLA